MNDIEIQEEISLIKAQLEVHARKIDLLMVTLSTVMETILERENYGRNSG